MVAGQGSNWDVRVAVRVPAEGTFIVIEAVIVICRDDVRVDECGFRYAEEGLHLDGLVSGGVSRSERFGQATKKYRDALSALGDEHVFVLAKRIVVYSHSLGVAKGAEHARRAKKVRV